MHLISPGGFALAIVILAVVWIFLPPEARAPLAIVLLLGALSMTQHPEQYFEKLKGYLK